jgi:hypothetical protein
MTTAWGGALKYVTAIIAVCFTLLGCGTDDRSRSATERDRPASPVARSDRDATERAALPVTTDSLRLQDVTVDRASAQQVVRFGNGWTVWTLRGEQTGPAVLAEGSAVVCLAIIEASTTIAARCAAETVLGDPARSMIVLSGGAAGAPGLGPGEALIAGAVPERSSRVWLESEIGEIAVRLFDGVFVAKTRALVTELGVVRPGWRGSVAIDACQTC